MLGVGEVEAAACVPAGALVAVGGEPAGVAQEPGEVHEVPGHEGGGAVGEVVLGPSEAIIEVGGTGACFAEPGGVGLGWDGVAEVLEGVENVHGAVLGAVLVAGDKAATDPPVIGVLAGVVEQR